MGSDITLGQISQILKLLDQKEVSSHTLQKFINSGILADVFDADPSRIDREKLSDFLGVIRLSADHSVRYKIWNTIRLGVCKSGPEYRGLLREAGKKVTYKANSLLRLDAFPCGEKTEMDLVELKIKQLGHFDEMLSYDEVRKRASLRGLQLCPAEVAPVLLHAMRKNFVNCRFNIAMEPMWYEASGRRGLGIFQISHPAETEPLLHVSEVQYPFHGDESFLFVLPRENKDKK